MSDLATLQGRLQEAETALHVLMTGQRAVQVRDASGRMVTYAETDAEKLQRYVAFLKAQIAALQPGTRRRVIHASF